MRYGRNGTIRNLFSCWSPYARARKINLKIGSASFRWFRWSVLRLVRLRSAAGSWIQTPGAEPPDGASSRLPVKVAVPVGDSFQHPARMVGTQ